MTDIATTTPAREPVQSYKTIEIASVGGGGMLLPQTFGDVVAFADLMSRSQHAIPKHLRGNPGACMAVTMQALRWEMDPFAVAAKAYSVNDMIAYEAQLIAAVVYTRAPIRRRPDYAFSGTGPDLVCTVTCEMLDGSVKVYVSPREGEIKTKNSPLWKTDPQQQLGYYSIRSWARRYTPEVLLGVYAPDELEEYRADQARDVTPSGMAERLAATKSEGGFSTARVETEIAAAVAGSKTDIESSTAPGQDRAASAVTSPADAAASDEDASEAGKFEPQQSNLSEPPTGEDGRAEREPTAAPLASLSADDRAFLGRFAAALRPGHSPKDLLALREQFGKANPSRRYAENTPEHAAVQAIYAIETKRVVGEMSLEDADARIEGVLS